MRKCILLFLLFCLQVVQLIAQTIITGTVTSAEDNSPVPGVTVRVKGISDLGTVTTFDGKYSLSVPKESSTLVFSFVGMKTLELPITGTVVDAVMQTEDVGLNEVVVTGYGVQKKREVTSAISMVKGNEIANYATPSFDGLLAGKSTGVQISTTTGILGKVPTINIRGVNSITSGTYPLVIVDGVPIFTQSLSNTTDINFGTESNALGDINPADIESIEILKDGSATAIYGSRAANGVVLITTKKGSQGKIKVSYNTYFGVAQTIKRFDLLNSTEFAQIANEKFRNAASPNRADSTGNVNTDWQKVVFRDKAKQQDHNLSMAGGTEKTTYFLSLGYTSQEGIAKNNSMQRYSMRFNVDQKIFSWLSMGASSGVTRAVYSGLNTGQNSLSGNVFAVNRMLPNVEIYNPNDVTGYNIDAITPNILGRGNNTIAIDDNVPNIKFVLDHNKTYTRNWRIIGSAYADLTFLKAFKYRTQISIDTKLTDTYQFRDSRHGDGYSQGGLALQSYEPAYRWNLQNVLSYNNTFSSDHNLGLTLVSEVQKQKTYTMWTSAQNLTSNFFNENVISGSYTTPNVGGNLFENGFVSFAGRLNYNYKLKYFLQASVRRDAISDLPEDNRYGIFPGGSVGWTISEEPFLKDNGIISDLKIRASYAEVGNTDIGNYPYMGTYGTALYGTQNGISFNNMGNYQLKWETSKKTDAGVDMAFLKGKFKLNFDYFINKQSGLILQAPTANSLGVPGNYYYKNVGSSTNKGYEFSFSANLLNTKDFSWNFDANLTLVQNEITTLVNNADIILPTNGYVIIRVGESLYSLYGYDYAGVNMANGNPLWRKADGSLIQTAIATGNYFTYDPSAPNSLATAATLAATDRKILGNTLPTYFGSFSTSLKYKNLNLKINFRYSGGNKIFDRTRSELTNNGFLNNSTEILGRWQSVNNPGDGVTPKLYYGRTQQINLTDPNTNGRFVEKGDYLRLQDIRLSYNLPQGLISKTKIDLIRIFGQVQNVITFTKYKGIDPDMSGNVFQGVDYNANPLQRTITFGLNVNF